jgi:hypothetical protein
MSAPGIPPQFIDAPNQGCAEWIEMDVARQLQEIWLVFAYDGLIAVLEKVSIAAVAAIEVYNITCQELSHGTGERLAASSQEDVEMIGKKDPCIDSERSVTATLFEAGDEILTVHRVTEYESPLHTAGNHMMQSPGCVEACVARHRDTVGSIGHGRQVLCAPTSPIVRPLL